MPINKKVLLILALAMPLACIYTAETAGTNTPPAAGTNTPQAAGTSAPPAGQSITISLSTGKTKRDAWIHIPAGYSSATAVPLVLNFHGDTSTGKEQEALSGMSALADREGFLVAYPNGINQKWDDGAGADGAADRQFVRDLVKKLMLDYTVDPKRIFATDMSNGGGMTNRVGCSLADIFAAVAPVEGGYKDWTECSPSRPVPIMAFHGITDLIVPYNGGNGGGVASAVIFPSIPDWAAAWANRDSCNATPKETHPNADLTRQEWTRCAGGASVILYSIDHQGHSWPGSKLRPTITSQAIDASAEMWRFFQAHPMP
jgi:polyhydroxybutyrate depolymerase